MKHILDAYRSVGDLWTITGSFGRFLAELTRTDGKDGMQYTAGNGSIRVDSIVKVDETTGVNSRVDTVTNISSSTVELHRLLSKFVFDGGEYEVYTQYNGWENESRGGFQPLVAKASVSGDFLRTSRGANPFAVLWNKQNDRGVAFHLLADSLWKIDMTCVPMGGEKAAVEVELGVDDRDFCRTLLPGESIQLPEILCYEVRNRLDLDGWRLHQYVNRRFPAKTLPIIYNTWLNTFDRITRDKLMAQIPYAAALGAEYFVIDAGWFGDGRDWYVCVGDWKENTKSALCGSMRSIADEVRRNGMKFGLWFELERAVADSEAVKEHPEEYRCEDGRYFLDFSNEKACERMLGVVDGMIERYGIEFIKSDFNDDLSYDTTRTSFMTYYEGYHRFITELKRRHPDVYLENCGSGGMRMNLGSARDFGSFWLSDNQSPYDGVRIIKESLCRLPSRMIERWATITNVDEISEIYGDGNTSEKILSTNDAIWKNVTGVDPSYLKAFLLGGPIGFSCDLTKLSKNTRATLASFVADFKRERAYFASAACRLLCDTPTITAFEYHDDAYTKITLAMYAGLARQSALRLYPAVDEKASYRLGNGEVISGRTLAEEGLPIALSGAYMADVITLIKE